MNSPMQKALAVVKKGSAKVLSNYKNNKYNASADNNNTKLRKSSQNMKPKNHDPFKTKYKELSKRGFKYPANVYAKYMYKNTNPTKYKTPNRRINKLIVRKHNRLVLSHLSWDDRWDLPRIVFPNHRSYYYLNALQFVYLIARSHRGTSIGLRKAMAEIAMSIINGGISANEVIRFARSHRGGVKNG